ncbi:MAG: hypothetical protein IT381_26115 [Deltaproteobacteria bacterium]|nr:hypothetical protein [Deltaproteobacteria bacterium]
MSAFAWVMNLDADFELARRGYSTPAKLAADLLRHGGAARALLGEGDVLIGGALAGEAIANPSRYLGRAFCPTQKAIAIMRRAGVEPEAHPDEAVLRRVNHRRFACALGGGLREQRYVETRAELEAALAGGPKLLKRPLAFAGRGQLRVSGALGEKDDAWIAASLREDGLVVEPLVTPSLEVSVHGFVTKDGACALGRICVQATNGRGVFRSARLADRADLRTDEARALLIAAERTAAALRDTGYFGPFGIDGYRYERGFCALSEINARYTMAFAIGFGQGQS